MLEAVQRAQPGVGLSERIIVLSEAHDARRWISADVGEVINANVGGQCVVPVRTLSSSLSALHATGSDTSAFWQDAVPPIDAQLREAKARPYELELEAEGASALVGAVRGMTDDALRGLFAGTAVSTSVGKLDTILAPRQGSLSVSEAFMCTSNGGTTGTAVVTFGAWTHGGSLTVRASFNDGALDADLIASIADRVVSLLAVVSR